VIGKRPFHGTMIMRGITYLDRTLHYILWNPFLSRCRQRGYITSTEDDEITAFTNYKADLFKVRLYPGQLPGLVFARSERYVTGKVVYYA